MQRIRPEDGNRSPIRACCLRKSGEKQLAKVKEKVYVLTSATTLDALEKRLSDAAVGIAFAHGAGRNSYSKTDPDATFMRMKEDHSLALTSRVASVWDCDSLDWKGIPAGQIQRRVLDKVQPGSIVLFHNAAENTPEALPGILEALLADGYTIVPISQLLLKGDSFIDNTGRQCQK